MPVEYEIHSTWKRAAVIIAVALIIALAVTYGREDVDSVEKRALAQTPKLEPRAESILLVPVINLEISDASLEAGWSKALAKVINGRTEHEIPSGRVDVLNDYLAIEVDRIEKWHEGLGQALHYAKATDRMPCLALIIPSDSWPMSEDLVRKLRLVEATALSSGAKVVLLRRSYQDANET